MAIKYIPFFYTLIFSMILVSVVPKAEIRRLSIYGIIFGAIFDVILVTIANITGSFTYINYEPFGLMGIHFLAPISWAIFFILYFYFLPDKRYYIYLYIISGIFYSIMFCQMITKLGVLKLSHGIIDSIIPFVFWFPLATWGYFRLRERFEN
ncbi:hypothetical protein [Desulfosporosinus youngiae]|uniref:Uncharacterized protein n=1 Tax=Desulfosporosinus youngiae DSM 17734 TaxID=768710 RepID=H5XWF4_9FIRM|nr:hypothetical protein [Desulfosporosinus youngiae]EHQ90323.1 hypothetical protein DesyoDRAFT_3293 [Desulfosporosinus youngiae DSM 17734]